MVRQSIVRNYACAWAYDEILYDIVKDFFTDEDPEVQTVAPLMSKEERRAQRILEPGAPKRKLLEGSKQLTSHQGVLVRFHKFNMGVTVDIEEMLHQMFTRKEDRHSQRFLWRDDPSGTPDIYNMDVATFVLICSPASAQYIKNMNAEEFEDTRPKP